MFYSQLVLAKKGPLGKVWLAAHWDRKLTKNQIMGTDISQTAGKSIALTTNDSYLLCSFYYEPQSPIRATYEWTFIVGCGSHLLSQG